MIRTNRRVDDPEDDTDANTTRTRLSSWKQTLPQWVLNVVVGLISCAFALPFVIDITSRADDEFDFATNEWHQTLWIFFDIANISMTILFLICVFCQRLLSITSFLIMIVNFWSIVYIVLPWFGKPDWGDRVGATIGMISSICHQLFLRCCLATTRKSEHDETTTTRLSEGP